MTVLYFIVKLAFYFAVFLTCASITGWIKRKRAANKQIDGKSPASAVKEEDL